MTILDLSCDGDCATLQATVAVDNAEKTLLFEGRGTRITELAIDSGQHLRYLNLAGTPIGSIGGAVVSIDLERGVYETLFSDPQAKYYPTFNDRTVYFSEATSIVAGTRNPAQRRALYAFDIATGHRRRVLEGIVAYQIGRPFISSQCLVADFVLPVDEHGVRNGTIRDRVPAVSNQNHAFCFPYEALGTAISLPDLERMRLVADLPSIEQVSVDANGKVAVYFAVWPRPGWFAVDLLTKQPLFDLPGGADARYVIAPGGSFIGGAQPSDSGLKITVRTISSGHAETIANYDGRAKRRTLVGAKK